MKLTHPSRRVVFATASTLALAVTAAAGTAIATGYRNVTLEVDGVSAPVHGFFTTVDDALDSAGVTVGAHDLVAPAVDSAVANGDTIVVRSARRFDVTVDGKPIEAWSTASSLDEVLKGVTPSGSVVLAADRSAARAVLPLTAAASKVAVEADGQTVEVDATPADTPQTLLDKADITASPIDRVAFVNEDDRTRVRVTRVTRTNVSEQEVLAHTSEQRENADMYEGETEVVQAGQDGSVMTTYYRETLGDQQVVNVKVSEERIEPVTEIVEVGTKSKPAASPASSGGSSAAASAASAAAVSGDPFALIAQCESGGNPTTNTGNGYYGMYQFSLPTWRSVGGTGLPSDASAEEQTMRARMLQERSGWGQWGCSYIVGIL